MSLQPFKKSIYHSILREFHKSEPIKTLSGTLDQDFRASSIFGRGPGWRDLSGGPYGQVSSASTEDLRDDSTDSLPARQRHSLNSTGKTIRTRRLNDSSASLASGEYGEITKMCFQ